MTMGAFGDLLVLCALLCSVAGTPVRIDNNAPRLTNKVHTHVCVDVGMCIWVYAQPPLWLHNLELVCLREPCGSNAPSGFT